MSEDALLSHEHAIGPASEIPAGASKVIKLRNMNIGVYNVDGTYYAFHNICPHQFGPLCEGRTGGAMSCNQETHWLMQWGRSGEIVICPWHGMEFDLKTGECLAPKKYKARTFPVRVIDGELRISLARANSPAPD